MISSKSSKRRVMTLLVRHYQVNNHNRRVVRVYHAFWGYAYIWGSSGHLDQTTNKDGTLFTPFLGISRCSPNVIRDVRTEFQTSIVGRRFLSCVDCSRNTLTMIERNSTAAAAIASTQG